MSGHVYFVGTTWHVKIGFTTEPLKRVRALRAGCPLELETLVLMPGTKDDEKRLHRKFSHLSIGHEWFRREYERQGEIDRFLDTPEMVKWLWNDEMGFADRAA